MKKLTLKIMQKEPGSDPISIEMVCRVTKQQGEEHRIASMLLDVEQLVNVGKPRLHLFVVK